MARHDAELKNDTIHGDPGEARRNLLTRRQLLGAGAGVIAGAGTLSSSDRLRLDIAAGPRPDEARHAAMMAYMSIKGTKQGQFKGSPGKGSNITLLWVGLGLTVPYNATNGQATGSAQHAPFVLTKPVDESSPQILTAAATQEYVTANVTLLRKAPGKEVPYYQVTLEQCIISSCMQYPSNSNPSDISALSGVQFIEDVELVYNKITVFDPIGKTTYIDYWSPQ